MPPISSILGSVRLGYKNESLFMQGLGHRNLILLTVMLNSYLKQDLDSSLRLITVEEGWGEIALTTYRDDYYEELINLNLQGLNYLFLFP